jgi:hypothetical protein
MRAPLILAVVLATPIVVHAEASADALARCLADNTSGKDRKDLARWMFLAMAAHPEIKQYAAAAAAQAAEQSDEALAALITRLLTESCVEETRAASKQGGTAFPEAFKALGGLAMQEIMSNPDVKGAMGAFEKHLDRAKFDQALK